MTKDRGRISSLHRSCGPVIAVPCRAASIRSYQGPLLHITAAPFLQPAEYQHRAFVQIHPHSCITPITPLSRASIGVWPIHSFITPTHITHNSFGYSDNALIISYERFVRPGRHSFITPTHIAHNSFRHDDNPLIVRDERFVRQERHTFIRDSDMYKRGPLCAPRSEPAQCPKPSRLREGLRIELREDLRKGHLLNHWA